MASDMPAQFELPAAVYSPALLESVMYDIQFYLDWIRQNQIRKTVGAKTKEEPTHSAETVLVIEAWLGGKPATLESLEGLLVHLRGLKLPEVHIMLAALPNRVQRETLVAWFRANVSPKLLLSFVADRNLGGGLVVRTPNRVFDYSWKQQLVSGRSKLAEILKHV
jgi:ATP synthase delta (OSCP) subunit